MSNSLPSAWRQCAADAAFPDAGICAIRATRFERTIRRRNAIEYIAGVAVIALFAVGALWTLSLGLWDFAAACLMVLGGTIFVLWQLHRSGSFRERRPEQSCREHLRNQLVRQRELLRRVPLWYLAPLVPGIGAVYGFTVSRVASRIGWLPALEGVWAPLAGTVAFFGFVAWLNLFAARRLDREIRALDVQPSDR